MARADMDAAALTTLISEAVELHARFFGTKSPRERFEGLRTDLDETWKASIDAERRLVEEVEAAWDGISRTAFRDADAYDALRAKIDASLEPACKEVGLLDLLGRARRETLHTRALGALIDPHRAGKLAVDLLTALIDLLASRGGPATPAASVLERAQVTIEPEYVLPGRRKGVRYPTPDLRITLPGDTGDGAEVIIIENKIDDTDREGQLASYAECTRNAHGDDVVLAYLTPTGNTPTQEDVGSTWLAFSYRELAIAWRRVLHVHDAQGLRSAWVDLLRAYLATVVREVCALRLNPTGRAQKARLVPYLRAALGEKP